MTMKQLMERAGTSNFGFANAFLEDGIREINMMIEESVAVGTTTLTKDQRFYGMEEGDISGLVKILYVSILDEDTGDYYKIPRVVNIDTVDKDNI
jgi:hypothetical protein